MRNNKNLNTKNTKRREKFYQLRLFIINLIENFLESKIYNMIDCKIYNLKRKIKFDYCQLKVKIKKIFKII